MAGIPSGYVTTLKQSLASGGSESEVFVASITTLDGQTLTTADFAQLGSSAYLVIDPASTTNYEICSFTAVDGSGIGFTGITRGLSLKGDGTVLAANKKFHAVGTTVIISWGAPELQKFMDLSSNQTVAGIKTYTSFPVTPSANPTTQYQVANKGYVDGVAFGSIGSAGTQTAGSVKVDQNPNTNPRVKNVLVQQQSAANMTLKVLGFDLNINEFKISVTGTNTATMAAPTANPRIDLVVATTAGAVVIRTGTEAASPTVPTPSTGDIVLAEVYHQTTETVIKDISDGTNGYIQNWLHPALYRKDMVSGFGNNVTTGGIAVYGANSQWSILPTATSGYLLTAQGPGATLSWAVNPVAISPVGTDTLSFSFRNSTQTSTGVSITTNGSQRLFIVYSGNGTTSASGSQPNSASVQILIDGSQVASNTFYAVQSAGAGGFGCSISFVSSVLSSASHTVQVRVTDSSATGSATLSGNINGSIMAISSS